MSVAKLQHTTNYELFEAHEYNRPLHDDPYLLRSMQTRGFMPSSPIHVTRNGNGKLKVIRGHHRLSYAKRLGLPVYYVVDDAATEPWDLEMGFGQHWTQKDYVYAHAQTGKLAYQFVLNFAEQHGLAMGVTLALLGGQSDAVASNLKERITSGRFVVTDLEHAERVAAVIELLAAVGVSFARQSALVTAISKCARVEEFDVDAFTHKVSLHAHRLGKRGTVDEYVDEIEAVYNYGVKAELRVPLALRVKQVMSRRNAACARS